MQYWKLSTWWNLEDEEIEEIILQIYNELQQQRYSPRYFKDMIVTFMQIENIGFNCFDYDKIVKFNGTETRDLYGKI